MEKEEEQEIPEWKRNGYDSQKIWEERCKHYSGGMILLFDKTEEEVEKERQHRRYPSRGKPRIQYAENESAEVNNNESSIYEPTEEQRDEMREELKYRNNKIYNINDETISIPVQQEMAKYFNKANQELFNTPKSLKERQRAKKRRLEKR